MSENQKTMIDNIDIMEKWIKEHNKDDERIRMNAEERSKFIYSLSNVLEAIKGAKAVLRYMQRGHVFDVPKEISENRSAEAVKE